MSISGPIFAVFVFALSFSVCPFGPVQAQSLCDTPENRRLEERPDVSFRDSQGRCTLDAVDAPFDDDLYGPLPSFSLGSNGLPTVSSPQVEGQYLADGRHVGPWDIYRRSDHLNLRMGFASYNKQTNAYAYFNRYEMLTRVALHVNHDQWALFDSDGNLLGAIYGVRPPTESRDARLIEKYDFVYDYPYFGGDSAPEPPPPPEVVEQSFRPAGLPCHREGRDSQGRCAIDPSTSYYQDDLYADLPDFDAFYRRAGPLTTGQLPSDLKMPDGYILLDVHDGSGYRLGYVAWHRDLHDYIYFSREGRTQAVALHVDRDQWALFGGSGYLGVIYGSNTWGPRAYAWNIRMVTHYPFLFE